MYSKSLKIDTLVCLCLPYVYFHFELVSQSVHLDDVTVDTLQCEDDVTQKLSFAEFI